MTVKDGSATRNTVSGGNEKARILWAYLILFGSGTTGFMKNLKNPLIFSGGRVILTAEKRM